MTLAGKLELRLDWDGEVVRGVEVKSTRPRVYRVLQGRFPENAVQFVPMLYSVCGKAQQAAAGAALAAAQGKELQQAEALERQVICEAMQEHLWRLLLDWPQQLGLSQAQEQFVSWHGALNAAAAGQGGADGLLAELPRVLLGMPFEAWLELDSYGKLEAWMPGGKGLLAPLAAELERREKSLRFDAPPLSCGLLPQWNADEARQIFAGNFDEGFTARPQLEGKPMETGALARWHELPLLQDVLSVCPGKLLARWLARVADLLDGAAALAQDGGSARISFVGADAEAGLSVVQTARGMLLHHVQLERGKIASYLIAAPTEWNFHPQGALAGGLTGLQENDEERLLDVARTYVLSLDPCVEYEIGMKHA